MNIDKAIGIVGWMSEGELMWLAKQAINKKCICEVGTWKGRSARALADNTSGQVYAIDTFRGTDNPELAEARAYDLSHPSSVYSQCLFNLADHIEAGKVVVRIGVSDIVAQELLDEGLKFDMIFIDGDHEYEQVSKDIVSYSKLLSEGGLFCGHDASWHGVAQALAEHIKSYRVIDGLSIWVAGQ